MNENATGGEIRVDEHPSDEMLRADRLPHILCPGCGIGSAMHSLTEAITESETDRDKHVCVSGIGCSGRVAGYKRPKFVEFLDKLPVTTATGKIQKGVLRETLGKKYGT